MNEIQQDYLIGLVHKKLEQYNLEDLKDVNVNNDSFVAYIDNFIDNHALENDLINEILNFINGEENYYENKLITIEKIGIYVSVSDELEHFTILSEDFKDLLISLLQYLKSYLPLGSIVMLNKDKLGIESDKDEIVVIEQRMIQPKGKNYYIDYRSIPYPTGAFNEAMYTYFSEDDIKEVIFKGYSDLENEGYELLLKESLIGNHIYNKKYQVEMIEE
ncbi:MAG: DUF4176 domain-containing protein [Bacilli bacterium]|jgi:hypothetical protein|nr:DUF4176 domain-containing protein [Bacilli bacterium]